MPVNSQEVFVTIIACIGLFLCIAVVLVSFILHFQRKKYVHNKELVSIAEASKRQLVQSKLEVAEETRLYIARELHDNIGTLSSLIKINLNLLSEEKDETKKTAFLAESKELAKTLITEVKQLSVSLNTERLVRMSFSQLLNLEVERIRKLNLFIVEYGCSGEEWSITPDSQLILYRVCQEILHNIIKHADPFKVCINLNFERSLLTLRISDDGNGFLMETEQTGKQVSSGSGLLNIYARIHLIGGKLLLDSSPGKGTKYYIELPLTNPERE